MFGRVQDRGLDQTQQGQARGQFRIEADVQRPGRDVEHGLLHARLDAYPVFDLLRGGGVAAEVQDDAGAAGALS